MSQVQYHHVVTRDHQTDDVSSSAIDCPSHQHHDKSSRASVAFNREHLRTSTNPVHPQSVSSASVDRSNRTYLGSIEPLLGPTPRPPDTCHPSGEAPAALPCSVGGNLGRSPC